jgi:hypothetical protein
MHPPPEIDIDKLLDLIVKRFTKKYKQNQIVCSLSRNFLTGFLDKKVEDQLIQCGAQILLASSTCKKRDADYLLNKQIVDFIAQCNPQQSKIVLISSDADFILAITMALNAGLHVQLIYNENKVGKQITKLPFQSTPISWIELLKEANNGVAPDTVIYERKMNTIEMRNKSVQTDEYELLPIEISEFEYHYDEIIPGKWCSTQVR